MLKKEARKITGGLSKPSKMPGPAYNLPASRCKTGAKLTKIPGSVCAGCYALKGRYRFGNVQAALERRYKSLDHPQWTEAMTTLVKDHPWFRWHDSGDIRDTDHLEKIFKVCASTPETRHWLPTREPWVQKIEKERIPKNLCVRVSGSMIDGPSSKSWPWTSTVVKKNKTSLAANQGNKCLDCRQCWNRNVKNVAYGKH